MRFANGSPSRSVNLTAAVPVSSSKEPTGGVSRLVSVTGRSAFAGAHTVELRRRYSASVSSVVQLTRPLASRTHSVSETTV